MFAFTTLMNRSEFMMAIFDVDNAVNFCIELTYQMFVGTAIKQMLATCISGEVTLKMQLLPKKVTFPHSRFPCLGTYSILNFD